MKRRIRSIFWSVAMALAISDCTMQPTHGSALGAGDVIDFTGFAIAPGASIQIQAKSPVTGVWGTIDTATADTTAYPATNPTFSRTLYSWGKTVTVPSGYISGNQATLRAQQLSGSTWATAYMYDDTGLQCLLTRYLNASGGELDVDAAGADCSDGRFEVTVHR